jgi:O-methyltransferase
MHHKLALRRALRPEWSCIWIQSTLGVMQVLEKLKCRLAAAGVIVYRHASDQRSSRMRSINAVKSERALLLTHVEAEQLINAVIGTARVPGELAEVGVFRGASARLLRQYAEPNKTLHLCDTFEGLPDPDPRHDAAFNRGEFAASLAQVQDYLGLEGIVYHVGRFPLSADDQMRSASFSFVHLDVDLYESTLECLEFFYPRLSQGGILLSHDFGADRAPGVIKAFREYFGPRGVPFIQLSGFQGMVVKLASGQ